MNIISVIILTRKSLKTINYMLCRYQMEHWNVL